MCVLYIPGIFMMSFLRGVVCIPSILVVVFLRASRHLRLFTIAKEMSLHRRECHYNYQRERESGGGRGGRERGRDTLTRVRSQWPGRVR